MIRPRVLLYIAAVWAAGLAASPAEGASNTEYYHWGRNPFAGDRNPTRPRTVYGVHKAYRSFVMRHNGITPREARIIAQYRLVKRHLQSSYDFRKPRIVGETEAYFVVRFPGKFSVMSKKVNIFIFHIAKSDGAVLASFESDKAPLPQQ